MKTQTLLKSIFSVVFITVLLHTVSCDAANNPSAFVGRWVNVGVNNGIVMEFLSDGTGIITDIKGSGGVAITWKTENGRFYFTTFGIATPMSYKMQGSVLTLTEDNGKILKLTKCKKDCQEAAKEYFKEELAKKVKKGSFTDSRDGRAYKTVKFDNQTWMAENLNYNANGSKCYENQESNCQKYGRLYDWKTAKSACPNGWHLPSYNEWQILEDFAGGDKILKASSGWNDNGNGWDAFGFSALPGGYGYSDGRFLNVGEVGRWWTAREYNDNCAYFWDMGSKAFLSNCSNGSFEKWLLSSVRCVQD